MSLARGTRLGPYEILSSLGAGGMGDVYRARDTRLGRDVALKIMRPEIAANPAARQRFEQEVRADRIDNQFAIRREAHREQVDLYLREGL